MRFPKVGVSISAEERFTLYDLANFHPSVGEED